MQAQIIKAAPGTEGGWLEGGGIFKRGSLYLLRPILVYKPRDLNRDWSPRFSTLRVNHGWIRAKTA